jgi:hypothetical protein
MSGVEIKVASGLKPRHSCTQWIFASPYFILALQRSVAPSRRPVENMYCSALVKRSSFDTMLCTSNLPVYHSASFLSKQTKNSKLVLIMNSDFRPGGISVGLLMVIKVREN